MNQAHIHGNVHKIYVYSCQCTNESLEHQTKLVCASRFCFDLRLIICGAQMYERNYVIHVAYVCVCVMELKFLHERIGVVALLPGESGTESKGKELAFTSKSSYK